MRALIYKEKDQPLSYEKWPDPTPGDGEIIVDLKAAALNHRDVFITQGLYPGVKLPVILGSDGAGLYDGREVIINPTMDWGEDPRCQSKRFQILGLPTNGTFAEKVAVRKDKVHDKPEHLTWEQAAAVPLGGLTAYRALFTKGECEAGQKVLISGVGGGVALMAFQFALASGAKVFVTSGSSEKIERAIRLGAQGAVNYKSDDWARVLKSVAGGFDLIIDSAGGDGFAHFTNLVKPGGKIVLYGGTRGKINGLSPQKLFWKQASIHGSTMGTDQEFADMVAFIRRKKIVPIVDATIPLPEGQKGLDRMAAGEQFGKIVFST